MDSTAMDLDSSLDDIIKKKQANRNKHQAHGFQTKKNTTKHPASFDRSKHNFRHQGSRNTNHNVPINTHSRTIGKSILQRTNLVTRPDTQRGSQRPAAISSASLSNRTKLDPSKIVITKTINNRVGNKEWASVPATSGVLANGQRQGGQFAEPVTSVLRQPAPTQSLFQRQPPQQQPVQSSLSIRGLSRSSGSGMSIRGESGPTTVLISNLDPAANADDVKAACAQFGTVTYCEVMTDRSGRSYGEAEVEFANKASALECISKLDNEVADGRVLRAVLRTRSTPVAASSVVSSSASGGYAQHALRSVIAPTRSGYTSTASGKLYSDSMIRSAPAAPAQNDYSRYERRY